MAHTTRTTPQRQQNVQNLVKGQVKPTPTSAITTHVTYARHMHKNRPETIKLMARLLYLMAANLTDDGDVRAAAELKTACTFLYSAAALISSADANKP